MKNKKKPGGSFLGGAIYVGPGLMLGFGLVKKSY